MPTFDEQSLSMPTFHGQSREIVIDILYQYYVSLKKVFEQNEI